MTYIIEYAPGFERRLVRFLRLHSELKDQIGKTLKLLKDDVNHPSLKTHKLHGKLNEKHACSINYYYRFVFKILGGCNIYMLSIGSHDDVY